MTERKAIEQVLEAYRAAVHEKDVDALVALYDDDVRVFDMWSEWSYDSADAWRGMAVEWFGSLGSERVAVELQDVGIVAGDSMAVVHAFLTFKAVSAEGEELRAMCNRLTWALRKNGEGAWKVVHEHTSAPLDFETSKPILQR